MAPSGPSLHIQTKEKSRVWPFSVEQGPLQSLVKRTAAVFREKEKCLLCPPGSAVGRCAPRCSHWQFGWLFCTQAPGLPRPPRRGWAGHSGASSPGLGTSEHQCIVLSQVVPMGSLRGWAEPALPAHPQPSYSLCPHRPPTCLPSSPPLPSLGGGRGLSAYLVPAQLREPLTPPSPHQG